MPLYSTSSICRSLCARSTSHSLHTTTCTYHIFPSMDTQTYIISRTCKTCAHGSKYCCEGKLTMLDTVRGWYVSAGASSRRHALEILAKKFAMIGIDLSPFFPVKTVQYHHRVGCGTQVFTEVLSAAAPIIQRHAENVVVFLHSQTACPSWEKTTTNGPEKKIIAEYNPTLLDGCCGRRRNKLLARSISFVLFI